MAVAFLDGLLGSDEISLGDWADRYSDSRNATGAYLFLKHKKFSDVCGVVGVIVDHNDNEIDSHEWDNIPYDFSIKDLFKGGEVGDIDDRVKAKFYIFD
jgi:hypothetical protein